MRRLSKYHQARVDRESHHLFILTHFPEFVGRGERFIERQFLFLLNLHTPKIIPGTRLSLWGIHPTRSQGLRRLLYSDRDGHGRRQRIRRSQRRGLG